MINIKDELKSQMASRIDSLLRDKGLDDLNRFLLLLIVVFLLIDLFFKIFIIGILEIIFVFIFIFRIFSKNKYKRVKENRIYLEVLLKIKEFFRIGKKKAKSFKKNKNNIYKKCPSCGTILKLPLPKKIGIKHTTCPTCNKRFGFLCLRKKRI